MRSIHEQYLLYCETQSIQHSFIWLTCKSKQAQGCIASKMKNQILEVKEQESPLRRWGDDIIQDPRKASHSDSCTWANEYVKTKRIMLLLTSLGKYGTQVQNLEK